MWCFFGGCVTLSAHFLCFDSLDYLICNRRLDEIYRTRFAWKSNTLYNFLEKASEVKIMFVKKNGAARLDPCEIFVLLALKFRFILFRLENKKESDKKKVNHKFEIAFN